MKIAVYRKNEPDSGLSKQKIHAKFVFLVIDMIFRPKIHMQKTSIRELCMIQMDFR